jgi:hypothetical protein
VYRKEATLLLEVFRELEVLGNKAELDKFVSELGKALPKGWTRDRDRERQVNRYSDTAHQMAFYVAASPVRPAAHLFLISIPRGYRVSNVVPEKLGKLTRGEYNYIVEEFRAICAPIAVSNGLQLQISSNQMDISEQLTPRSMKALTAFEGSANITSLHPLDSERWRKFLILAHKDNVDLSTNTLERWLIEEKRWPEDRAIKMVIEYEFARELLKDYDGSGT